MRPLTRWSETADRCRFPHLAQVLMNGDADVSDKNIIGRMLSKCQPKMVYTTGRTTVFMPKGTLRRLQELEAAEKVKVQKAAIPRVPLAPVPVVPTPVVLAEPAGKGLSSSASPPPPPPPPPPPALPRLAASRPPASLPQAKQDPSADLTQSDMSMVSVFEPPKIAVLYDSDRESSPGRYLPEADGTSVDTTRDPSTSQL